MLSGGILASCGMAGSAGDLGSQHTIVCLDPEDGSYLTLIDDLDPATPEVDVDVTCQTTGFEPADPFILDVLSVVPGTTTTYPGAVDAGGLVVFGPVTLAFTVLDGPGDYVLVARGEGAASDPVTVHVVASTDSFDGELWEENCTPCTGAADCDDGLTCTGREQCAFSELRQRLCCKPNPMDCTVSDPCLTARCDEAFGGCVSDVRDDDGDGHPPAECGGLDCNDHLYATHQGAREVCDGTDNDCDGLVDEGSRVPSGAPVEVGGGGARRSHSLASGSSAWGVAWISDDGSGPAVFAGTIQPASPAPVVSAAALDPDAGTPTRVQILDTGTGFAILVSRDLLAGGSVVDMSRMAEDGTPDGSWEEVLVTGSPVLDLSAAWTPATGAIGLFFRSDPDGAYDLYFHSFDPAAPVAATDADLVRISSAIGFSGHPSPVGTTAGFAVAWEDARDGDSEIWVSIVDPGGSPLGPSRRLTAAPGASESPALSALADGLGLVWMDARGGSYEVLFTCLDPTGTRECPDLGIAGDAPAESWYPDIIPDSGGSQYVIAYGGRKEDGGFGVFLTAAGGAMTGGIDPGTELDFSTTIVLEPSMADVAGWRGLLWASLDASGAGSLFFQELGCAD